MSGISRSDKLIVYDPGDRTKRVGLSAAGVTTGTTRVLTAPDANGVLALLSLIQTWTAAQTFGDSNLLVGDSADLTRIARLECSGITTGTTRTMTVPDSNGTIALRLASTSYLGQTSAIP